MADRACIYCEDGGDCARCSYFFERDTVHKKCGIKWGEHEMQYDSQGFYPPAAICKRRDS